VRSAEAAVIFVRITRWSPTVRIINDKLFAYAFILTHEVIPAFLQDYFNWIWPNRIIRSGIDALVKVHDKTPHLDAGPVRG